MECLRKLSKNHFIAIIASIHQPNNEIVLMFDNCYVLTKNGNCLFSGPPKQIESHLSECNISLNENQIPIEQLLKLASIEIQNKTIEEMIRKTRETLKLSLIGETDKQLEQSPNGVQFRSKSFKLIDMWYIIMRSIQQQFIKQWKSLLFRFFFYIFIAFFVTNLYNENIGKSDACLESSYLNSNNTCYQFLNDQFLLFQNLNFLYFTTLLVLFTHLSLTTLTYVTDLKIFLNEYQNCEHIFQTNNNILISITLP